MVIAAAEPLVNGKVNWKSCRSVETSTVVENVVLVVRNAPAVVVEVMAVGLVVVLVPPIETGVTVEAVSVAAAAGNVMVPNVAVPTAEGAVVCDPTSVVISVITAP